MNQLTIIALLLVLFTYCGGKHVPKLLKNNKEKIVVIVSVVLALLFKGKTVEGLCLDNGDSDQEALDRIQQECPSNIILADLHNLSDECKCAFKFYVNQCGSGLAINDGFWSERVEDEKLSELQAIIGATSSSRVEDIYKYIASNAPSACHSPKGPSHSSPPPRADTGEGDLSVCEDDPDWFIHVPATTRHGARDLRNMNCSQLTTTDCDNYGRYGMGDACQILCRRWEDQPSTLGDATCRL